MAIQLQDISQIIKKTLDNQYIDITTETKASDIPEWDSLNHVYLVVAIEKKFKVKFSSYEIISWQCVGDILRDINNKIA